AEHARWVQLHGAQLQAAARERLPRHRHERASSALPARRRGAWRGLGVHGLRHEWNRQNDQADEPRGGRHERRRRTSVQHRGYGSLQDREQQDSPRRDDRLRRHVSHESRVAWWTQWEVERSAASYEPWLLLPACWRWEEVRRRMRPATARPDR